MNLLQNTVRLNSHDSKIWVDITDQGILQDLIHKICFDTSFKIDESNSFMFLNSKCAFYKSPRLVIQIRNAILMFYFEIQASFHLTIESFLGGRSHFSIENCIPSQPISAQSTPSGVLTVFKLVESAGLRNSSSNAIYET